MQASGNQPQYRFFSLISNWPIQGRGVRSQRNTANRSAYNISKRTLELSPCCPGPISSQYFSLTPYTKPLQARAWASFPLASDLYITSATLLTHYSISWLLAGSTSESLLVHFTVSPRHPLLLSSHGPDQSAGHVQSGTFRMPLAVLFHASTTNLLHHRQKLSCPQFSLREQLYLSRTLHFTCSCTNE